MKLKIEDAYNIETKDKFNYTPCYDCLRVIREKLLAHKDKTLTHKNKNFINNNFDRCIYTGINSKEDTNIEHVVPVSLFSKQEECLPYAQNDYHIMYPCMIDVNTLRQNYSYDKFKDVDDVDIIIITSKMKRKKKEDSRDQHIKYFFSENLMKRSGVNHVKNLMTKKFIDEVKIDETTIYTSIKKFLNGIVAIKTKDKNVQEFTQGRHSITYISIPDNNKMLNSCKMECRIEPMSSAKGVVARACHYFQLLYGHNPHKMDHEAFAFKYLPQGEKSSVKKKCYSKFDHLTWKQFYYDKFNIFIRWMTLSSATDEEHERNQKIAEIFYANLFIGAYDKNGKYLKCENGLKKGERNWILDLFTGRKHDHRFYQSLQFQPKEKSIPAKQNRDIHTRSPFTNISNKK